MKYQYEILKNGPQVHDNAKSTHTLLHVVIGVASDYIFNRVEICNHNMYLVNIR